MGAQLCLAEPQYLAGIIARPGRAAKPAAAVAENNKVSACLSMGIGHNDIDCMQELLRLTGEGGFLFELTFNRFL